MEQKRPVPEAFLKPYDPAGEEPGIYKLWDESGYFNPDNLKNVGKGPYSIVLPPPNVTGTLHMGHAAMLAIEDIFIRYHRMQGYKTLWLPGTDHAAIATQSRVEKDLQKAEGKNRHDFGREEFLARVKEFAQNSHDTIVNQVRRMGASVDWSREAYTLDEKRERAVYEAFKRMYDEGLIYRGERIVNWDPKGQTTISDDEIVHEERTAKLVTFRYGKDFPIPVATTRLETKVGDTAVAVHPDDARYKDFIGKEYDVLFAGVPLHIKVVADEAVDPEFGTGGVGVTPAHSQTDWEIARRHSLPLKQVINEYAKMTVEGPLSGKKVLEAREMILEWLKQEDLLIKEEDAQQNVATAERTGGIIEPLPKLQWWVAVGKPIPSRGNKTLKDLMREAVSQDGVEIMPDRFEKTYFHWIENLRDWCISRQIWFGHRIPVWYHEPRCVPKPGREADVGKCIPMIISAEKPTCEFCDAEFVQDQDTLDTWFSSGLWTFSTLGWPEETEDLKTYHPTSVLETGYDILFFWVARMILMSQLLMKEVPFRKVYLHGLVRDEKGRKMSKSLGNVIDPLDMINKYGADATRLSLIIGAAPGNDLKLSENAVRGYKNFANKIWNITRFVLENFDENALKAELNEQDQALLQESRDVATEVTRYIKDFRLDLAANALYHYTWDRFAAEVLEDSKAIVKNDSAGRASRQRVLYEILLICLKLLHPFMPYATEAIWQKLPQKDGDMLMIAKWPV